MRFGYLVHSTPRCIMPTIAQKKTSTNVLCISISDPNKNLNNHLKMDKICEL